MLKGHSTRKPNKTLGKNKLDVDSLQENHKKFINNNELKIKITAKIYTQEQ